MTISKTAANKIINDCFYAIPRISVSFSDVQTELFNMELKAEKEHRRGHPAVSGFSATQAAKYFTVSHLLGGQKATYKVTDILHIRNEVLYGQAYATEFKEQLQSFFEFVSASQFSEIDYSAMMK